MKYTILQLNDSPEAETLMFMNYAWAEKHGGVLRSNYDKVYEGTIQARYTSDALDLIYMEFNLARPEDFKGHSLSVSDVIILEKDGRRMAFFCDSVGWKMLGAEFIEEERA